MEKETCESCQFFDGVNNVQGQCHRYAPDQSRFIKIKPPANSTGEPYESKMPYDWPSVMASNWCGEHEDIPGPNDGWIMGGFVILALSIVSCLILWMNWLEQVGKK